MLTNHALAQGICEAAVLVRYETWLRPETLRWQELADDQWDRIDTGIEWFEQHAGELEGPVNLAHLTLGCALGYLDFRWPEHDWRTLNPGRRRVVRHALAKALVRPHQAREPSRIVAPAIAEDVP